MAKKISKAGERTEDGTLRCPSCGGTSFENRRGLAKFVFGIFAPKSKVRCQTCGKQFKKG